jgi:hypothetical protein
MKKNSIKLTRKKMTALAAAFVLSAMTLVACGHSSSANSDSIKSSGSNYMAEAEMPMEVDAGTGMFARSAAKNSMDMDMDAEVEGAMVAETAAESGNSDVATEKIPDDRKLIRNVNLSFETTEFDTFIRDIQNRTTELGGYVESSDINGNEKTNSNRYAYFTLRIPKPQVDTFLDFAEGSANLTRKYENTQDITLRYHDTESRKKALKEEYDRLLELMAQAESVDAIITIEQRLSDIRYELDNYESDLRSYDNQVDYSTVTVDVTETKVYSPTPKTTFWGRVSANLESNIEELAEALTDFLVWFISSLPIFLFLLFAAGIIWFIVISLVKLHSRKAAKKAAKMAGVQIPAAPGAANAKTEPAAAVTADSKTKPASAPTADTKKDATESNNRPEHAATTPAAYTNNDASAPKEPEKKEPVDKSDNIE